MADVQELMNKMESLNKEITTIINETKQGLTVGEAEKGAGDLTVQGFGGGSSDDCPKFTRKVKLCCTTVVKHFNVLTGEDGTIDPETIHLIYDPSCLHAVVEKELVDVCHDNCSLYAYVVKIVGCIPFAFSATGAIKGVKAKYGQPGDTCPNDDAVDLCCQCCVCVDNNICCYADKDDAKTARDNVANLLNCSNIIITQDPSAELLECKGKWCNYCHVDGCKNETYVKFEATLTLIPETTNCESLANPMTS